jgi:hypothetical protein
MSPAKAVIGGRSPAREFSAQQSTTCSVVVRVLRERTGSIPRPMQRRNAQFPGFLANSAHSSRARCDRHGICTTELKMCV